jgi:hypothetical protein
MIWCFGDLQACKNKAVWQSSKLHQHTPEAPTIPPIKTQDKEKKNQKKLSIFIKFWKEIFGLSLAF